MKPTRNNAQLGFYLFTGSGQLKNVTSNLRLESLFTLMAFMQITMCEDFWTKVSTRHKGLTLGSEPPNASNLRVCQRKKMMHVTLKYQEAKKNQKFRTHRYDISTQEVVFNFQSNLSTSLPPADMSLTNECRRSHVKVQRRKKRFVQLTSQP